MPGDPIEEEGVGAAPTTFLAFLPVDSSTDRHRAGLSCRRRSVWRNQWMFRGRALLSPLLEVLAMVNVEDERIADERRVRREAEVAVVVAADAGMKDEIV